MSLSRLFDTLEQLRDSAHWRSAFGEPQTVGDRTIIPIARVWYGFGLGFGQPTPPAEQAAAVESEPSAEDTEKGGAGGGAISRPIGAIVVTPDEVHFEEAGSYNQVALAGIGLAGWMTLQVALTLREVFGRR